MLKYGFPTQILHDQGGEFENELFYQLEKLSGVKRSHTTPYHPMCNGKAERFNRTLLAMLRTLPESGKSKWKDHLQKIVHAYNATVRRSTGYTPFYLMFGREPVLPVDFLFDKVSPEPKKPWKAYVKDWKAQMEEAYRTASEISKKVADKNKKQYDKTAGASMLQEGDRVLVRNLREKGGPGKLRGYWEKVIYRVLERRGSGPVYVVQPEDGGEVRVLHRNHLLSVGEKLEIKSEESEKAHERRTSRKKVKFVDEVEREVRKSEDEDSSSEDSSEEEEKRGLRRSARQRKGRETLNYGRLGSPGYVEMSSIINQVLEQQQVLMSIVCAVLANSRVQQQTVLGSGSDGILRCNSGLQHGGLQQLFQQQPPQQQPNPRQHLQQQQQHQQLQQQQQHQQFQQQPMNDSSSTFSLFAN